MTWNEIAPGSGMYRHEYDAGVTFANSVALRLDDGRIAVISPSSQADEAHFEATEALGEVVALIAPSTGHDLGQKAWQARYPEAAAYGPSGAIEALNKLGLRPFQPFDALDVPDGVELVDAPGAKTGSLMCRSTRGDRHAVYIDEIVGNSNALPSHPLFRLMFWLTGSAPGLKMNKVYGMMFTKDKAALVQTVLDLVDDDTVVCCAHGELADGASVRALLGA